MRMLSLFQALSWCGRLACQVGLAFLAAVFVRYHQSESLEQARECSIRQQIVKLGRSKLYSHTFLRNSSYC